MTSAPGQEQRVYPRMQPTDISLLRYLARTYSPSVLIQYLVALDRPNRMSTISTSTFSSSQSITTSPWGHSDASTYHSSDAASINGSIFSQASWPDSATDASAFMQSETASLSGTEWSEPAAPSPLGPPSLIEPSYEESPPSPTLLTNKPITCPICYIYRVAVGFTRKSDFKKHLNQFHNTDTMWVCRHENCKMVFDFEKAYATHVKSEHPEPHIPADRAKVAMCPQLVFACGYVGCKDKLFEADCDEEAPATAQKYFEHVAGHFDKKTAESPKWEYRVQMQNLLRQSSVKEVWKLKMWNKNQRNELLWQPRSSGDLKKMLECRHLGDLDKLVWMAFTLGSTTFKLPDQPPPDFIGESSRPILSRCPLARTGHSQFSISQQPRPQPQAVSRLQNRTSSASLGKLQTTQMPSTPSMAEEPMNWEVDIVGGPHPGTLLTIPEDENCAGDPDPFDPCNPCGNDNPMQGSKAFENSLPSDMHQSPHPLSSWPAIHARGMTPSQEAVLCDFDHPDGMHMSNSPRPKTPKRLRSLSKKSLENLRPKKGRNTSPSCEMISMPAIPAFQQPPPTSQPNHDIQLPYRVNSTYPTSFETMPSLL